MLARSVHSHTDSNTGVSRRYLLIFRSSNHKTHSLTDGCASGGQFGAHRPAGSPISGELPLSMPSHSRLMVRKCPDAEVRNSAHAEALNRGAAVTVPAVLHKQQTEVAGSVSAAVTG